MTYRTRQQGFTLVETLVAITIMTLAILAPFEAVERVTLQSRLASENLVASALAQEGLEYVRYMRTSNYLYAYLHDSTDSYDPIGGLDGSNPTGKFNTSDCTSNLCTIDASGIATVANAIQECSGTCAPLWLRNGAIYTQTSGTGAQTIYTRSLSVTGGAGYETATITITWQDHGTQVMVLSQNFYDWL